jgi:hypothetical protein
MPENPQRPPKVGLYISSIVALYYDRVHSFSTDMACF